MCGIQAIISREEIEYAKALKAGNSLKERGPDCDTIIWNRDGYYRFCRLAINDLTIKGNQPMISWKDGEKIIMMCNGEIYNYKYLIERYELKVDSGSDCEVILRLYEKFGFVETIKKLNGIFAIILTHRNSCYFARDNLGVKPLFIGCVKGGISLGSTVKSILSFSEKVQEVQPGICFKFNRISGYKEKLHVDNSLTLLPKSFNNLIPFDQAIKMINVLLTEAVVRRLPSYRKIGCLLSGGLDSSIITSILVKMLGKENVRTYSIGMKGSVDLKYARIVSQYLGTCHTEVNMDVNEAIKKIPKIIEKLETYDITTIRASVGMFMLCEWIKNNTDDTVIFSGEGSDELLCGYLYFHNAPSDEEAEVESVNLLKNMYKYDVLRADRCISSNGLELREPFLDKNLISYVLLLPSGYKVPILENGKKIEKYLLRKAFETYLPKEVLWRRKDGFSDGVSGLQKPWYKYIQEFVRDEYTKKNEIIGDISDIDLEKRYYKETFDSLFDKFELKREMWLPKWSGDCKDPSGRRLSIFDEKN